LREISKAADEAEHSLIARKIITAAHKEGAPFGGSAPTQRYGASRLIIRKDLPRLQRASRERVSALRKIFHASQHVDTAANRRHESASTDGR